MIYAEQHQSRLAASFSIFVTLAGCIALIAFTYMQEEDPVIIANAKQNQSEVRLELSGRSPVPASDQQNLAALHNPGRNQEELSAFHSGDINKRDHIVKSGDTLINILLGAGIDRAEAHNAISNLATLYDPRQIKPGQRLWIQTRQDQSGDHELASLAINLDFESDIHLKKDQNGSFYTETVKRKLERKTVAASAVIEGSLLDAGLGAGIPFDAIMATIQLFSWDVDFQRDIKKGDRLELLFNTLEANELDEKKFEHLLLARIHTGDEILSAYRFQNRGSAEFYDPEGYSMRKSLLRTPVDGARISSVFGMRKHPIRGYTRKHNGVDFAAPTGTPIFAAGDGVITEQRKSRRGYGNYIRLRHNSEYETAYAHLHRFNTKFEKGSKVKQGDIIGYVGSTGLSTGPHLHFEILQNGRHVDPLKVKTQNVFALKGEDLETFKQERAKLVKTFENNLNKNRRQVAQR